MTTTAHDTLTTELQRLYGLERTLRSELGVLASDVGIDTLDGVRALDCRERLQERIETHREETASHVERLEDAFDAIDEEPGAGPTPELDGWAADKEQFNNVVLNDALRPLYYLAAAKTVEEIERSMYEPVLELAGRLEDEGEIAGVVDPLERNYEEERAMLEDLESITESEATETLLETIPVDSTDRSAIDRRGLNVESLEDLFEFQLRNVYYVERTLAGLLEGMASEADGDELEGAFTDRGDRARTRVDRLERAFDGIGHGPTESRNHAVDGLVAARRERRGATDDDELVDLGTVLAAERLERRSYEDLVALADRIGYPDDVLDLLEANRHEERAASETLEGTAFEGLPGGDS